MDFHVSIQLAGLLEIFVSAGLFITMGLIWAHVFESRIKGFKRIEPWFDVNQVNLRS
jgi:hypothetical protein